MDVNVKNPTKPYSVPRTYGERVQFSSIKKKLLLFYRAQEMCMKQAGDMSLHHVRLRGQRLTQGHNGTLRGGAERGHVSTLDSDAGSLQGR